MANIYFCIPFNEIYFLFVMLMIFELITLYELLKFLVTNSILVV